MPDVSPATLPPRSDVSGEAAATAGRDHADHVVADQSEAFGWLADPASHGLSDPKNVVRIDTHAALVVLAGPFAYKAKRAVRFPFLDFSTLEKREAACRAELRIDSVYAPQLYLGLLAIVRDGGRLRLAEEREIAAGACGEVLEWVVWMRRFPLDDTLDRVAERGGLTPALVDELASMVVRAHAAGEIRPSPEAVETVARYLDQNEEAFAERPDLFPPSEAAAVIAAGRAAFAACEALLRARCSAGFVRRCHGDLHLRNIVLLDGHPTLFDAIEFDERIATCDVLYDLAFLLMDLWHRGFRAESNAVMNRYLWRADEADLPGLAALPLFLSIRASIRAKVDAAGLAHLAGAAHDAAAAEILRYFALAGEVLRPVAPRLVAVGGLSGTGKSTLAAALAAGLGRIPGAVHLRSDIERKRLFGVAEADRLPPEAYAPEVGERVYAVLLRKARVALAAGASVIVDAVHARPGERSAVAALAADAGVRFSGLWLDAPVAELTRRVETRTGDASDATADVVVAQSRYDLGTIDWLKLDAAMGAEAVAIAARRALGLP